MILFQYDFIMILLWFYYDFIIFIYNNTKKLIIINLIILNIMIIKITYKKLLTNYVIIYRHISCSKFEC